MMSNDVVDEDGDEKDPRRCRHRPWQSEWKRPRLRRVDDDDVDDVVVGQSSSSPGRARSCDAVGLTPEETTTTTWVVPGACPVSLRVVVSATGDRVVLTATSTSGVVVVRRDLRWPSSASSSSRGARLVAARLCRRRRRGDDDDDDDGPAEERAAEALEVLRLASLGVVALTTTTTTKPPRRNDDEDEDEKEGRSSSLGDDDGDGGGVLTLCCLTDAGHVHLFEVANLLRRRRTKETKRTKSDDDDDGVHDWMASMLFGAAVHEAIERDLLPLSDPCLTVSLRLLEEARRRGGRGRGARDDDGAARWEDWLDHTNFDPALERYRTSPGTNEVTDCVVCGDLLVVSGRGRRLRRNEIKPATEETKEEEAPVVEDDGAEWWAADHTLTTTTNKEEEEEDPHQDDAATTTKTTNDPSSVHPEDDHDDLVGGFLILVSLRHGGELRTLYLPFAPGPSVHFAWDSHRWLLCPRRGAFVPSSSSSLDRAAAVAVRLDPAPHRRIRRFSVAPIALDSATTGRGPVRAFAAPAALIVSREDRRGRSATTRHALDGATSDGGVVALTTRRSPRRAATMTRERWVCLRETDENDEEEEGGVARTEPWCASGPGWSVLGGHSFRNLFFVCWEGADARHGGAYVRRLTSSSSSEAAPSFSDSVACLVRPAPSSSSTATARGSSSSRRRRRRLSSPELRRSLLRDAFAEDERRLEAIPPAEWATMSESERIESLESLDGSDDKTTVTSESERRRRRENFRYQELSTVERSDHGDHHGSFSSSPPRRWSFADLDDDRDGIVVASAAKEEATTSERPGGGEETRRRPAVADAVGEALRDVSRATLPPPPEEEQDVGNPFAEPTLTSERSIVVSKEERSSLLLKYCPNWKELEEDENHDEDEDEEQGQIPVLSVLSDDGREHVLSLRRAAVVEPLAPFRRVVAWLCRRNDHRAAAALTLRLLRGDDDEDDDDDAGLADGAALPEDADRAYLPDAAVACLVRGGTSIEDDDDRAATENDLARLLASNPDYDADRACLLLAATAATVDDLWPVRCLAVAATARDRADAALRSLNAATPDELRRRGRSASRSEELVRALASSIPDGAGRLLRLADDAAGTPFWESLDDGARLAYALLTTTTTTTEWPFLEQDEVRGWIAATLFDAVASSSSSRTKNENEVPSDWLRRLCAACLADDDDNAGREGGAPTLRDDDDDDDVETFQRERDRVRAGVRPRRPSDHSLLVPALLVLASRGAPWRDQDDDDVSTEALLDAACWSYGRAIVPGKEEDPRSSSEAASLARQCALANRPSAAARLIGGANGLVLTCCDVLRRETGTTTVDEAERVATGKWTKPPPTTTSTDDDDDETRDDGPSDSFVVTDAHRELLALLREHVLRVRRYGDLDPRGRGEVDPVFAARTVLRTWEAVVTAKTTTKSRRAVAATWLTTWLRRELGFSAADRGKEPERRRRLASTVLARALLWNDDDDDAPPLGERLGLGARFATELALACCGTVRCLPDAEVRRIATRAELF